MNLDFGLILVVLLAVMLAVMLLDTLLLKPKRKKEHGDLQAKKRPWYTDWAYSFFTVILFVFVLRSFVIEPFRIPSGSMLPTLESGDMIVVNKFTYGVRLPVIDKKIIAVGDPEKGDIIVFKYPPNPSEDYVKRVVGTPGDKISYDNNSKELRINGQLAAQEELGPYVNPEQQSHSPIMFREFLPGHQHRILKLPFKTAVVPGKDAFLHSEDCEFSPQGFQCQVPEAHYFVMGDNRDNSQDSRFWGFVPDQNIVGKVFFIWMNFGELSRIGKIKE